jgi:anaerobic selenocysteine-containing dehydrogenase
MFGHWLSGALPDIERTDCCIVLGANPLVSNGSMWTVPDFRGKAKALQARGGELVVIDPRRTETAAVADAHHFIRPGADVFLLAAMVHTLFAENLVKLGGVAEWVQRHGRGARPWRPSRRSVWPHAAAWSGHHPRPGP